MSSYAPLSVLGTSQVSLILETESTPTPGSIVLMPLNGATGGEVVIVFKTVCPSYSVQELPEQATTAIL